jgi:formimidoylglutamate deiminase
MGVQGDTILDTWIFACDDRLVTDVWSAGRKLVTAGRHYARDQVMQRYGATAMRLRGSL